MPNRTGLEKHAKCAYLVYLVTISVIAFILSVPSEFHRTFSKLVVHK